MVFCQIKLVQHAKEYLTKFENEITQLEEILECFHVSGNTIIYWKWWRIWNISVTLWSQNSRRSNTSAAHRVRLLSMKWKTPPLYPFKWKGRYRTIELFLLFILSQQSLPLGYPIWLKLTIGILGFGYILWVLWRVEKNSFALGSARFLKPFWKGLPLFSNHCIANSRLCMVVRSATFVFVPFHKPRMFLFILLVYSMFSVLPQGILYRTFFQAVWQFVPK